MREKNDTSAYLFSNKLLLALILPMVLEQTVNLTVGLMDTIMVAAVGEAAVSGVSLIDNVYTLILNVFSALSTGGAVIAGQYMGQRSMKKAREASTELVWTMMLTSLIITALLYVGRSLLLNGVFGKIDADVHANAQTYLMIVNLSVPFMGMYNGAAAILRTRGDSDKVLKTSFAMGLINLAGNAIGVYVLKLGIAGVAVPTLIARACGGIGMMYMLFSGSSELTAEKSLKHRFDWGMIKRILGIGVPNGLENGLFQLGKIVLVSVVSTFGTTAIAANAVTNSLAAIQVIPGLALQLALTTVISRCVGAGDYAQARYYTKRLLLISCAAMFVLDISLCLSLPWILKLYRLSEATAAVTARLVLCHTAGAVGIWPLAFVLPATFRAAGDVRFTMCVSVFSMCVFRVLTGYMLSVSVGLGVLGVWLAMIVDWLFRSVMFSLRYFSGKWETFKSI